MYGDSNEIVSVPDVEVLVVVVEEVELDHLVVPQSPHRHVGALGVEAGLLGVGAKIGHRN